MSSPMDNFQFNGMRNTASDPFLNALKQARQNPQAFEENVRRTNPQAYQQAMQLRNAFANPQQAVMQIAQQKGINPNIIRLFDM